MRADRAAHVRILAHDDDLLGASARRDDTTKSVIVRHLIHTWAEIELNPQGSLGQAIRVLQRSRPGASLASDARRRPDRELHVRILARDDDALLAAAQRDGVSKSFIVRRLVRQWTERQTEERFVVLPGKSGSGVPDPEVDLYREPDSPCMS